MEKTLFMLLIMVFSEFSTKTIKNCHQNCGYRFWHTAGTCLPSGQCRCRWGWTGPNAKYIDGGKYNNQILADYCTIPCHFTFDFRNPRCIITTTQTFATEQHIISTANKKSKNETFLTNVLQTDFPITAINSNSSNNNSKYPSKQKAHPSNTLSAKKKSSNTTFTKPGQSTAIKDAISEPAEQIAGKEITQHNTEAFETIKSTPTEELTLNNDSTLVVISDSVEKLTNNKLTRYSAELPVKSKEFVFKTKSTLNSNSKLTPSELDASTIPKSELKLFPELELSTETKRYSTEPAILTIEPLTNKDLFRSFSKATVSETTEVSTKSESTKLSKEKPTINSIEVIYLNFSLSSIASDNLTMYDSLCCFYNP
ncbi:uncharacterized protein LOC105849237 [Hydra vulgaris]|uniref:uncharacterized protein LOC105849237 n=1 Tax=Hydra vulgaris TaxID=6087 RepID=UPI001F5FEC21|nr:uncharacterized protein LOC105849237 [Hydra vulgaris]